MLLLVLNIEHRLKFPRSSYTIFRAYIRGKVIAFKGRQFSDEYREATQPTLKFSFPWIFGGSFLAACDGGGLILHLTAAGVDLNNECHWTTDGGPSRAEAPLASGPAVRVYLVMLLVFLASLEPANTLLRYLTRTCFRHECVKTAKRWNTFGGLLRRGQIQREEGQRHSMEMAALKKVPGEAIMHERGEAAYSAPGVIAIKLYHKAV